MGRDSFRRRGGCARSLGSHRKSFRQGVLAQTLRRAQPCGRRRSPANVPRNFARRYPVIAIELSEYDPRWPRFFEEHQKRIAAALHGRRTRIDHIGSTSVAGLAAKPVIDILVQGASYDDRHVRSALQSAGYELAVDEPGHRMFASADQNAHVHLWVDPSDSERHIRFRDWLRAHPEDCELYAHVKRELAKRTWETRDDYAEAKTPVIRAILRRAGGEALGPRTARFANLLLERLPPHARILEIGAGEGLLAKQLAAAGHDVVALDTHLRSTFPIVE